MSIWSTLGKIGLGVAAPFTGGASLAGIPMLDALGQVASGVGAGRQQGRESEAGFQQRQDQLGQSRYLNEIAGARTNLEAPQQRAQNSVRGDILANAQPFQWTGTNKMVGNIPVPEFSGGLNPGLFSDNTRRLGQEMNEQALTSQYANGGNVVGAPPALTPLPQAGKMDSILSTFGQLAPFLSMIPYGRQQSPPQAGPVSSNVQWPRF